MRCVSKIPSASSSRSLLITYNFMHVILRNEKLLQSTPIANWDESEQRTFAQIMNNLGAVRHIHFPRLPNKAETIPSVAYVPASSILYIELTQEECDLLDQALRAQEGTSAPVEE